MSGEGGKGGLRQTKGVQCEGSTLSVVAHRQDIGQREEEEGRGRRRGGGGDGGMRTSCEVFDQRSLRTEEWRRSGEGHGKRQRRREGRGKGRQSREERRRRWR